MASLHAYLTPPEGSPLSHIQKFMLDAQADHILLLLPNGTKFGYLTDNMTRPLSSLLGWEDLEFEALALSSGLREKITKVDTAGRANVQVDINIYGPPDKGKEVGEILSSHKVWFQRPDYYKKQFQYENPHVIWFPDLEGSIRLDELRNEASTAKRRTEDDVLQMVSEIQVSTHRADGLERVMGDRRLQTELLE